MYVCSTSSLDLLVAVLNDYENATKVVRYSGSTKTQCIRYDNKGQPLYLSCILKYISENKKLDIYLSAWGSNAVVVVNQAAKLRFPYTGPPFPAYETFKPVGITTDN